MMIFNKQHIHTKHTMYKCFTDCVILKFITRNAIVPLTFSVAIECLCIMKEPPSCSAVEKETKWNAKNGVVKEKVR